MVVSIAHLQPRDTTGQCNYSPFTQCISFSSLYAAIPPYHSVMQADPVVLCCHNLYDRTHLTHWFYSIPPKGSLPLPAEVSIIISQIQLPIKK